MIPDRPPLPRVWINYPYPKGTGPDPMIRCDMAPLSHVAEARWSVGLSRPCGHPVRAISVCGSCLAGMGEEAECESACRECGERSRIRLGFAERLVDPPDLG